MKALRKSLGYVWMTLGPLAILFMIWQAIDKIKIANTQVAAAVNQAGKQAANSVFINTILQWSIIILVFLPIAAGMVVFGKYAIAGEYDAIPASSVELEG